MPVTGSGRTIGEFAAQLTLGFRRPFARTAAIYLRWLSGEASRAFQDLRFHRRGFIHEPLRVIKSGTGYGTRERSPYNNSKASSSK